MPTPAPDTLSLIVPVYNEADNFPNLIREVERHIPPPFVLYTVYDFDADTTLPVAREFATSRPWLRLVRNEGKGVVGALRTGFKVAASGPALVVMADLSDDLSGVPRMLELYRAGARVVCPSRRERSSPRSRSTRRRRSPRDAGSPSSRAFPWATCASTSSSSARRQRPRASGRRARVRGDARDHGRDHAGLCGRGMSRAWGCAHALRLCRWLVCRRTMHGGRARILSGPGVHGGSGLSEIAFTGIVLKAVVFLGITVGIGHYLSGTLLRRGARMSPGMLIVVGLATCFALAFVAERVGLAGIIGAFAAGLMLDPYGEGVHTAAEETTLSTLLSPISSVFVPLFFVLMGIQVDLGSLFTPQTVTFGGVLVLVAVVGKLASAAGVVARGIDRLTVGIGMVPRGEVGLIFAGIGAALSLDGRPLLSQATFSALVLMVVLTTLLTPSSLRWALRRAATTSRT